MTIENSLRRQLSFILLLTLGITGCGKEDASAPNAGKDGSTISFVLNDNFSFGVLYAGFNMGGLLDTLAKQGPYTVLAPNNNAFSLQGISYPTNAYSFQFFTPGWLREAMRYTVIPQRVTLGSLPLNTSQAYKTIGGGSVYIKTFAEAGDTIATVNGFRLVSRDNAASNGLIQVLPQLLNPELYSTSASALRSDTTTALFAAAMQRAGLTELLSGKDEYTVLAPSNTAFTQAAIDGLDLSTLDGILNADPVKLATLLQYHIIRGRYFEGDLYHYASAASEGITTLNGAKLVIGGNPAQFKGITFLGAGNDGQPAGIAVPSQYSPASNNANIPVGNGVIHIINQVLIP
ncbi:fasciclin domain-containing protein [Chitinophaga sp.]|uniref:fasciclin domain-containing protein n=1 Tax=Chitinophaga sp. TaxID=1869181 RepID=UPI002B535F5E|nr:fasciclin domain-containing protein [Chitinophaga sp.]HWV66391.1 fasciclin domain-containing protein [Chitinophaga sp.]